MELVKNILTKEILISADSNLPGSVRFQIIKSQKGKRCNYQAGENAPAASNAGNIGIGRGTLFNSVNRSRLIAIGGSALVNNGLNETSTTHASNNMAIGFKALKNNTIGNHEYSPSQIPL